METGTEDDELRAMGEVNAILSRLDPKVAGRVAGWAAARYRSGVGASGRLTLESGTEHETQGAFKDFPGLFAQTDPKTESEKALVASYWFQVVQGQSDLDALQINAELKNMGHAVSNITRALGSLMAERPQLAIQTRKGGKSKQARKKYRLTAEGIRAVENLLTRLRTEPSG